MIFAIVGPSGAGKDTLIEGALKQRPDLRLIRRVITRPTGAGGEVAGVALPETLLRHLPMLPAAWHPAQISTLKPGYPRRWDGETETAFQFRLTRSEARRHPQTMCRRSATDRGWRQRPGTRRAVRRPPKL